MKDTKTREFVRKTRLKNRNLKWELFLKYLNPQKNDKLLDIGFIDSEDKEGIDNPLEVRWPYLENVTALGIVEPKIFSTIYPKVKTVVYDGKKFPFKENEFNISFSNAVIEHVGNRERQLLFIKEMVRVSNKVFFTTPNKFFPVELHTNFIVLHWLPKKAFDVFLRSMGKNQYCGNGLRLLSKKAIISLLQKAGVKEYRIIHNRFCFFTMTYTIIINADIGFE